MIEKLKIKNYRSIQNQEFNSIGNMMVLIGENNSGKSTVLNAIKTFNDKQKKSKNDIRHGAEAFEICIVKNIEDVSRRFRVLLPTNKILEREFNEFYNSTVERRGGPESEVYHQEIKKFIRYKYFNDEMLTKIGIKLICHIDLREEYILTNYNFSKKYSELLNEDDIIVKSFKNILANIDDERKFFEEADGSADSISNSVFNMFLDTLDSQIYERDIRELEAKPAGELTIHELNILFGSKLKDSSGEFLNVMEEKFKANYNDEYEIEWDFEEELKSRISFETKFVDKNKNQIDFLSTGSGTRSIYLISLLDTYINKVNQTTRQNGIFLIEEPELYLYPKMEARMGEILKEISLTNQVFLTSHSSNLINYLPSEYVFLVEKESRNYCSVSKYERVKNIASISEKLGFNAYPLIGKEFLILVEGIDDVRFYKEVINNHFPQMKDSVCVFHVGGVENVKFGVTSQFIMNSEYRDKTFIIVDSDGRAFDSIHSKYFMSLKNDYGYLKDEENFYERFYYTENATCLETLSFDSKLIEKDELDNFYKNINRFIESNKEKIESTIEKKVRFKILKPEEKNDILSILYGNKSLDKKFFVLKERVLTKKLIKAFRREVYEFKSLNEYSLSQQRKMIPTLLTQLEEFFGAN